jgi:hypothetical protein
MMIVRSQEKFTFTETLNFLEMFLPLRLNQKLAFQSGHLLPLSNVSYSVSQLHQILGNKAGTILSPNAATRPLFLNSHENPYSDSPAIQQHSLYLPCSLSANNKLDTPTFSEVIYQLV